MLGLYWQPLESFYDSRNWIAAFLVLDRNGAKNHQAVLHVRKSKRTNLSPCKIIKKKKTKTYTTLSWKPPRNSPGFLITRQTFGKARWNSFSRNSATCYGRWWHVYSTLHTASFFFSFFLFFKISGPAEWAVTNTSTNYIVVFIFTKKSLKSN